MKPLQLTREQQQQYAQRVNDELEKMTMSWDNELREWYPIALEALKFASVASLNVPQAKYHKLFLEETHGINMNVVMVLCNNLEYRTPAEMGIPAKKWDQVILLNLSIGRRWNELTKPVHGKIAREFMIMNNKPSMVIAEA